MSEIEWPEAGRELDALIAEKVMGLDVRGEAFAIHCEGAWSVLTEDPDADPSGWMCYAGKEPVYLRDSSYRTPRPEWDGWLLRDADTDEATRRAWFDKEVSEWDRCVERWGYHAYDLDVVPSYSTDIAAAWEVVEKMIDMGFCPALVHDDYKSWCLSLDSSSPLGPQFQGFTNALCEHWADTAPLAICRAAWLLVRTSA